MPANNQGIGGVTQATKKTTKHSMKPQINIRLILSAITALGAMSLPNISNAAATFTENAANPYYDSGWNFDSSQPNNFGWFTSTSSTAPGYSGRFIGDSRNIASPGNYPDINTSGESFGLYGGSGGSGFGQSDAYGFLKDGAGNDAPLLVGQTFSIDLAVNWRNGYKGIDLRNFGNDATVFNFNIGGDDYVVNSATTGNGSVGNSWSDNTVFHIAVTQTSAGGGTWAITRSGGVSDYDTGTYVGAVSSFKLYVGQTDSGSPNDFMANNIAVTAVPEPASATLLGLGCLAIILRRRQV